MGAVIWVIVGVVGTLGAGLVALSQIDTTELDQLREFNDEYGDDLREAFANYGIDYDNLDADQMTAMLDTLNGNADGTGGSGSVDYAALVNAMAGGTDGAGLTFDGEMSDTERQLYTGILTNAASSYGFDLQDGEAEALLDMGRNALTPEVTSALLATGGNAEDISQLFATWIGLGLEALRGNEAPPVDTTPPQHNQIDHHADDVVLWQEALLRDSPDADWDGVGALVDGLANDRLPDQAAMMNTAIQRAVTGQTDLAGFLADLGQSLPQDDLTDAQITQLNQRFVALIDQHDPSSAPITELNRIARLLEVEGEGAAGLDVLAHGYIELFRNGGDHAFFEGDGMAGMNPPSDMGGQSASGADLIFTDGQRSMDAGDGDDVVLQRPDEGIDHTAQARGGQGDDVILLGGTKWHGGGGHGDDLMINVLGDDTLTHGNMYGDNGNDLILVQDQQGTFHSGPGADIIAHFGPHSVIRGQSDDDIIFGLGSQTEGNQGDDLVIGGANGGGLHGGDGADMVFGGAGNDRFGYWNHTDRDQTDWVFGGSGDDQIRAAYHDVLHLGDGADKLVVRVEDESWTSILDFNPDEDHIKIDAPYAFKDALAEAIERGETRVMIGDEVFAEIVDTPQDVHPLTAGGQGGVTLLIGNGSYAVHLGAVDPLAALASIK